MQPDLLLLQMAALLQALSNAVRFRLRQCYGIQGDQYQFAPWRIGLQGEAGGEQRKMHALGDVMRGTAPHARVNAGGRSDDRSSKTDAAAEFRVRKASGGGRVAHAGSISFDFVDVRAAGTAIASAARKQIPENT